jgi:hypothetical protein
MLRWLRLLRLLFGHVVQPSLYQSRDLQDRLGVRLIGGKIALSTGRKKHPDCGRPCFHSEHHRRYRRSACVEG